MATIERAGFRDVQVLARGRPFAGASGERNAEAFGTEGVNIRAVKR
jgi:hypothetical protein